MHTVALGLALAFAAAAPPTDSSLTVGSLVPLEAAPTRSAGFLQEDQPVIARGASSFLAVWTGYGLTRARIDFGGTILDRIGAPVLPRADVFSFIDRPRLVYTGTHYVLVWAERRATSLIFGIRLDDAGERIDPAPVVLFDAPAPFFVRQLALATSGATQLVVFNDPDDDSLLGLRLDSDLCVIGSGPLNPAGNPATQATAAWNGTDFVVAWTEQAAPDWTVRYTRVTEDGVPLDDPEPVVATVDYSSPLPKAASNGDLTLLVWSARTTEPTNPARYFATRVAADGTPLDVPPLRIGGNLSSWAPIEVTFDGTDFVTVWNDGGTGALHAARVTTGGVVLDADGVRLSTSDPDELGIAGGGGTTVAVWSDWKNGNIYLRDIYAARFEAGASLDPNGFLLSRQDSNQLQPALDGGSSDYLAVWPDYRTVTGYDLVATRLNATGAVLDAPPIVVAATDDEELDPAIASLGANRLVGWRRAYGETSADVLVARINPSGTVLDPGGIPIENGPANTTGPAIASNGTTRALVVWTDNSVASSWDIHAKRVNGAGSVLDATPIRISTSGTAYLPLVDFDGTDFVVVWGERPAGDYAIRGARVTTGGIVRDPGGRLLLDSAGDQLPLQIAFAAGMHYVAWHDSITTELHLGRIALDLSWLDGSGVRPGFVDAVTVLGQWMANGLAYDGTQLVVTASNIQSAALSRFLPDMTLLDATPVPIVTATEGVPFPVMPFLNFPTGRGAAHGPGGVLSSVSAVLSSPLSPRAYVTMLDLGAGCLPIPRLRATGDVACVNAATFTARDSHIAECVGATLYRWFLDGTELIGETADTIELSGIAPGSHELTVEVTCDGTPTCTALSAPLGFDARVGSDPVGATLRLVADATPGTANASWTTVTAAKSYVVIGGVDPSGPFPDALAASATPTASFSIPAVAIEFIHVTTVDKFCGTGAP